MRSSNVRGFVPLQGKDLLHPIQTGDNQLRLGCMPRSTASAVGCDGSCGDGPSLKRTHPETRFRQRS